VPRRLRRPGSASSSGGLRLTIDLNADMAEGSGPEGWSADAALLDVITSANIACAGHAGDEEMMRHACAAALERGVRIGAHPGYADRENFGRVELELETGEIVEQVSEQIARLEQIATAAGGEVTHVKPHGALYHRALRDEQLALALAELFSALHNPPVVLAPARGALADAAQARGLRCASEGFADRAYDAAGLLVPRDQPGSILEASDAVVQAVRLASEGTVVPSDGTELGIVVDSICVHGDTPGALELARAVRGAIEAAGVEVRAFA